MFAKLNGYIVVVMLKESFSEYELLFWKGYQQYTPCNALLSHMKALQGHGG